MHYDQFRDVPIGSIVEFQVTADPRTWRGRIASEPLSTACEGGDEANHDCLIIHTAPVAFRCVDIQIESSDWPYEDSHPQYGREFALVAVDNVLRVTERFKE